MLACLYVALASCGVLFWCALQYPVHGVEINETRPGQVIITAGGIIRSIDPARPIVIGTASGKAVALPASPVIAHRSWGANGDFTRSIAVFDRAARAANEPGARVNATAADGTRLVIPLAERRTRIGDLPIDFWVMVLIGGAAFLIGGWVWALRPDDWGTRALAVSGLGMLISAHGGALALARSFLGPHWLMSGGFVANVAGTELCGSAMIMLFLVYPRRLVGPAVLIAGGVVVAAYTLAVALDAFGWTFRALYWVLMAEFAMLFAAIFAQWLATRGDPRDRAVLRWIGASFALGSGGFMGVMLLPALFGEGDSDSDVLGFVFLIAIYAGIAIGVGRYRLFALDRWAYRIMISMLAAALLIGIDGALVAGLQMASGPALAVALLVTGVAYIPLRSAAWQRMTGRGGLAEEALFEAASAVAFGQTAEERRTRWLALLGRLFDPLAIEPAAGGAAHPALDGDGVSLTVPATAGADALAIRFPARGRRLFGARDLALVEQVRVLVGHADAARTSYERGVAEERHRIAGDLHDDVSARLLTSLHRRDVGLVRDDVREAMADIRSIVSGLIGERRPLDQVVADLRHETARRLEAADIALAWPIGDLPGDLLLDHGVYRGLLSVHREAVSNILRHGRAGAVEAEVKLEGSALSLALSDDGCGIDGVAQEGNGLRNMRRRITRLGGRLAVTAGPGGRGTSVVLQIPLGVNSARDATTPLPGSADEQAGQLRYRSQ